MWSNSRCRAGDRVVADDMVAKEEGTEKEELLVVQNGSSSSSLKKCLLDSDKHKIESL